MVELGPMGLSTSCTQSASVLSQVCSLSNPDNPIISYKQHLKRKRLGSPSASSKPSAGQVGVSWGYGRWNADGEGSRRKTGLQQVATVVHPVHLTGIMQAASPDEELAMGMQTGRLVSPACYSVVLARPSAICDRVSKK